ncbi:hypothetical protein [Streptomyces yatensis]|uniref:Uncharacterized protein n=1 Tax=Streptomyces yatensis TaxID=155177 RepID=A0ABN2INA8_9ACTN|nr:hypothetical protein [Streptomyces yatensis]
MALSNQPPQPDVAFGAIPGVGVAAAVANDSSFLDEVLRQHGFAYNARRDVYLLPQDTDHRTVVRAVATATRKLQMAGLSVSADPRVVASAPSAATFEPEPLPRESLADLSAALPTLEEPSDVAEWLLYPVDGRTGVIPELRQFIDTAAAWCDRLDHPDGSKLAHHLREIAEQVELLGERITHIARSLDELSPVKPDKGPFWGRELEADHAARSRAATGPSPHRPTTPARPSTEQAARHSASTPATRRTR